jgi:hypothetical protein
VNCLAPVAFLVSVLTGLLIGTTVLAEDSIHPDKAAAIRQLLQITGAGVSREEWTRTFTQQMISVLKANNTDLDSHAETLIREEVDKVVADQMEREVLHHRMYKIYARYFTLQELQGLIEFNESPVGVKANRVMPILMRESMAAAQQWSVDISPELSARVMKRLDAEGISIGR